MLIFTNAEFIFFSRLKVMKNVYIIALLAIILIIVLFVFMQNPLSQNIISNAASSDALISNKIPSQTLIAKTVEEMIPKENELPEGWYLSGIDGISKDNSIMDGAVLHFKSKTINISRTTPASIDAIIFKFSDMDNAVIYYNAQVNQAKSFINSAPPYYEDIKEADIGDCYASIRYFRYDADVKVASGSSICLKNNIVLSIQEENIDEDGDALKAFSVFFENKITS